MAEMKQVYSVLNAKLSRAKNAKAISVLEREARQNRAKISEVKSLITKENWNKSEKEFAAFMRASAKKKKQLSK